MGIVAVVLVWGGLLLMLYGGSFLLNRFTNTDSLREAASKFEELWLRREGVFSRLDEATGRPTGSVIFAEKYPAIRALAHASQENLILAGTNLGLFVSRDNGAVFRKEKSRDAPVTALMARGAVVAFGSMADGTGTVFLSRDSLKTATEIFRERDVQASSLALADMALYVGLSDGRLMRYALPHGPLKRLAILPGAVERLAVGGDGRIYASPRDGGIYSGEEGGRRFLRQSYLDQFRGAESVKRMVIHYASSSRVYALTEYGFIRSTDMGATWQRYTSVPDASEDLVDITREGEALIAASRNRVYVSRDDGKSWSVFNPELERDISTVLYFSGKMLVGTK